MTIPFFAIFLIKDFVLAYIAIGSLSTKLIDQKIIALSIIKNKALLLVDKYYKKNDKLV